MRSQNNYEQRRETENKACTCIDLYSQQTHHSVYTNSDQLACFTQAHPRNTLISSKWGFRILHHSLEDLLTSAISSTFCGTGIFTSVISSTICVTGIFTIWQLLRQPASRSWNGAFLFGKKNNCNSRILRTSRLRIPLQRLVFETIREFQGQSNRSFRVVHIRRLLGISQTGWSTLEASQWRIAPFAVVRNSTYLGNFVLCVFPALTGSVPDTFSALESFHSFARARSYP